jgi:RNA polymerase sigma-70 factor (ECF subfamily)
MLSHISHASGPLPSDFHIVEGIAVGERQAVEYLYELIFQTLRPLRQVRLNDQDSNDLFHETFTIVMEAIQRRELRNPAALRAYIRGVVRRQWAGKIVSCIRDRKRMVHSGVVMDWAPAKTDLEKDLLRHEKNSLIERGLDKLRRRDSELLRRFYLHDEPCEQICEEMQLTETQFRLFKSRAKAKLVAWAQTV